VHHCGIEVLLLDSVSGEHLISEDRLLDHHLDHGLHLVLLCVHAARLVLHHLLHALELLLL
jgi:hypothetical protein